ncbi:MAG: hypothetical protein AAGN35_22190 [Bacteroidota bacterium]
MSYSIEVDGKRLVRSIYELAQSLAEAQDGGRLSHEDARQIRAEIDEDEDPTDTERHTIVYLLETLTWTEEAEQWIREELHLGSEDGPTCVRSYVENEMREYVQAQYDAHKSGGSSGRPFFHGVLVDRLEESHPESVNDAVQYYIDHVERADWGGVALYAPDSEDIEEACLTANLGWFLFVVRVITDGDDGWIELYTSEGEPVGYGRTVMELISWGDRDEIRAYTDSGGFPDELEARRGDSLWGK